MLTSLFRLLTLAIVLLVPYGTSVARAQSQPTDFPLTITDDSGVSTTFAAPPRRVVSLNPGFTEITFALGHGDALVGVDSYSDFPPEAQNIQPRLTAFPNPSVEAIVDLQPDLVLTLAESDDVIAQLRAQGVHVVKLFPKDYDATVEVVRSLGRLYGSPDAGEAIASDMSSRRDAVVAAVADAPRPRVYEELDASQPDMPFAAGPNGFYGQLIDLAGGTNIFADLPADVGRVSAESIVQRDPEVIILTDSDLPFNPQSPDMVRTRPGWDVITAVRNGAIYSVPGSLYSTPGPRLAMGLEDLARLLHPDRFQQSTLATSGMSGVATAR
ncbi:MAG: ABC transporter substrate-binding protein [Chloroflexi bacterium]|nr:ABC transporter substrate-binding protein [Chloroflexota bacterium]